VSGLAAIYHGDGRPADVALLRRMTAAIAHRGPDASGEWSAGRVALGHRLLYTTPESMSEVQPLADAAAECRLIWDGRIDDRDDLIGELGPTGEEPRTDPALLLEAYRQWGPACLGRVLGDFAFVLWDARRRRLFCGRDRMGLRPFHYTWDGTTLLISSEIRPLVAARGGLSEPDDDFVLAFLLREFREPDQGATFFQGIRRLPPAHFLIAEGSALSIERYWDVDPSVELQYAREDEYVEHLRTLFDKAVRCRLRSCFPVGVLLSGGLDSSAIAATAAWAAADGGPSPALETFTIYSSDRRSDEREHARRLTSASGLKGHELDAGRRDPLGGLDLVGRLESPIVGVAREGDDRNMAAILSRGCRVILSGEGGDQLLDEIGWLADLLYAGKPIRFLRATRGMADWYGGDPWELAQIAATCLAPSWAKYWGKRLSRGVPPPWMNRETARAVDLRSRVRSPRVATHFTSFAQAETWGMLANAYNVLKLEVDERYGSRQGIELRYPFMDSRLVELLMAIPWTHRTRDGERKRLLRLAMRGLVPEAVRRRRGKGDWTDSMDQALLSLCRATPPVPLRDDSGRMGRYIDPTGARGLVRRYLAGDHSVRWEIWSLITLDRWLAGFGNRASGILPTIERY
jgi:asparagine synthase (glutamine-hydrolysing)